MLLPVVSKRLVEGSILLWINVAGIACPNRLGFVKLLIDFCLLLNLLLLLVLVFIVVFIVDLFHLGLALFVLALFGFFFFFLLIVLNLLQRVIRDK